jgi:NitT/TauT family transport system ATP-binding protein
VRWTLDLVGLSDYAERWPYQLSGGQRQRIGIARGLAVDPDILLMDEPFGALDAITRNALQDELLRIWKETGKSILFVTHDIEEAVYLGDRVLLLGDTPAHIINEYRVDIDRAERRESEAFLREVEKVRGGLQAAIDGANNND